MKKTYDRCNERTRNLIKDTFLTLISEKELKKITIKEICERSNLNRGTFYLHFEDINNLLESIHNQVFDDINNNLAILNKDSSTNLENDIFLNLLNTFYENKKMYESLLFRDIDNKFTDMLIKLIEERCFNNWKVLFDVENKKNVRYFTSYVINGCSAIVKIWIKNDMDEPPEEIAMLLREITTSITEKFLK